MWLCRLEQLAALKTLAERLGYFGRAESLVEARVLDGITAIEPNAVPLAEGAELPEKTELVRLLAPMSPVPIRNGARISHDSPTARPTAKRKPARKLKRKMPEDPSSRLICSQRFTPTLANSKPPAGIFRPARNS